MKAYSLLQVKQLNDERREFSGIASSATVDRVGDVVVQEGMVQRGPVNLHLYHKHELPVGYVDFGRPTKTGTPFKSEIPYVAEAGTVQDRVNEAWHSVKYRLLGAVSIGFKPLADGVELLKSGGLKFNKWEMLELSLVSVPANPDAVIQSFKSMNADAIRSALGVEAGNDPERIALMKGLMRGGVQLVQAAPDSGLPAGSVRLLR